MKTIKQIANACGVSEQAVRGWCRRNHVAKDAKGSFAIDESTEMAILQYYKVDQRNRVAKDAKGSFATNESKDTINDKVVDTVIELFQKELDQKNEQLKAKDAQIAKLQMLLDQEQQLNAMHQQKILSLESHQKAEEEESENPETPKGFWAKLFGK